MDGLAIRVPAEVLQRFVDAVAERLLAETAERDHGADWPAWMSVATAARYLDCTEERIRKLVGRRAIPFAQEAPGCRLSFERAQLDRWMRESEVTPRRTP